MKRFLLMTTALVGLAMTQGAVAGPQTQPSGLPTVAPVDLGAAYHFVILSETGITDVAQSAVVGNVGTSPITGAADLLSCSEVTGKVYAVDTSGPAPCSIKAPARLNNAVGAMLTAYNDAASRSATTTELGSGNIGGLTLAPGVYSWSSSVSIPSNISLNGGPKDVWIFQIAQDLDLTSGTSVLLRGKARARNVFWQVAGQVTLGTTSTLEGIVLSKTMISVATGASVQGRLYAQTAVTLQKATVVMPKIGLPQ